MRYLIVILSLVCGPTGASTAEADVKSDMQALCARDLTTVVFAEVMLVDGDKPDTMGEDLVAQLPRYGR